MDLGFDTIGNATIIAYDRGPVLVTDPWLQGTSYFGSWRLSHAVPDEQMQAALDAEYAWYSHGHPDHLNPDSLELMKGKKILLPAHVGGRIRDDLREQGFEVRELVDRKWTSLSDRVKVLCIADLYQNGTLLIDIGGRLLVNTNDSIDAGWGSFVRKIVKEYDTSFMLALTGYGDADMINFYEEDGTFITPPCARKDPVGIDAAQKCESWGTSHFIPFSAMHQYHRKDSAYANEYATDAYDHGIGFESDRAVALPPFVRWDCTNDTWEKIDPKENPIEFQDPSIFGDDWSETLDPEEFEKLSNYFRRFEYLGSFLDFVNFRVGGKEHQILYRSRKFDKGLTFDVPRHSLMQAVEWEIFDDLLIGNFMKTTLHGDWGEGQLYPDFTPYVTKYGDNGRAYSNEELREYFRAYQKRAPLEFMRFRMELAAVNIVRRFTPADSDGLLALKKAYWKVKKYV